MSEKIKLVQGDTRPSLLLSLTDEFTGDPVDLTNATVRLHLRPLGSKTIKESIVCSLLPGIVLDDETVDTSAPYNVPGSGGRVMVMWSETALDAAGQMEAEVEITYADGSVFSVYKYLKLAVRESM